METLLRRVRGAVGMGSIWALAWFGAGMVLLLVLGPGAADVPFPLGFGLLGFLAGLTFSGVLALAGRRRSFDQISMARFALWGGVGGLLFGVGFAFTAGVLGAASLSFLEMGPLFALAGAGSAAGSLAVARRAEDRTRIEAGAEAEEP